MYKKNSFVISQAITMWANFIETGDVILSSNDCRDMDKHHIIKHLNSDQTEFVLRLRKLALSVIDSKNSSKLNNI